MVGLLACVISIAFCSETNNESCTAVCNQGTGVDPQYGHRPRDKGAYPRLLDILCPYLSRTSECRKTSLKGSYEVVGGQLIGGNVRFPLKGV